MEKKIKNPPEGEKRNFTPPQKSSLSFEELRDIYFLTSSEKEKRMTIRLMSKKATTFEDWLLIFGHSKEQNIHFVSEKQLVRSANTFYDLVFILKVFNLTQKNKKYAIEKALSIAPNKKDLKKIETICRKNLKMVSYYSTETRMSLIEALS